MQRNVRAICTVLLLGSCAHQQSAEGLFARIEHAIADAKSLRVSFSCKAFEKDTVGTLLLKERGKAYLSFGREQIQDPDFLLVSDGSRMAITVQSQRILPRNTPQDLNKSISAILARSSIVVASVHLIKSIPEMGKHWRLDEMMVPSEFEVGEPDGTAETLTYKLRWDNFGDAKEFRCKVWYDSRTYLPRKRVLRITLDQKSETTITETFTTFAINSPIEDRQFALVSEKKDESADEVFNAIEKNLRIASSLRLLYKAELTFNQRGRDVKRTITGELLRKGPNQIYCVSEIKDSQEAKLLNKVVCDGRTIALLGADGVTSSANAPDRIMNSWVRLGVFYWSQQLSQFLSGILEKGTTSIGNKCSGFRFGERKDFQQTILYEVDTGSDQGSCAHQLWYDTRTLKPVRLRVHLKGQALEQIVDETYLECEIDPSIPDEKFLIPSKDK